MTSTPEEPLDAAEDEGNGQVPPADDPADPGASDVPGESPLHDDLPS